MNVRMMSWDADPCCEPWPLGVPGGEDARAAMTLVTVRNGTAATPGSFAGDRGPIEVLSHDLRAHQGNPEITSWCRKCEERVSRCATARADGATPSSDLERAGARARGSRATAYARRARRAGRARGPSRSRYGAATRSSNGCSPRDRRRSRTFGALRELQCHGPLRRRSAARRRAPRAHGRRASRTARRPPIDRVPRGRPNHFPRPNGRRRGRAAGRTDRGAVGPPEAPRGDAADTDRTIEEGQHDEQEEPAAVGREAAAPITVHEQLVVRYVSALIGWVERSAHVRDQGPPDHVYDRIERLLQIQDGAA
jgi:hypothetical protein